MARTRLRGTMVDYLVTAIEPALIITMVSSLMFLVLDLSYEGAVLGRLRWILFWFVLGIVLITRVSMQIGSSLAMGYGVALGGAVALVASVLTGFRPLLLVILGGVWWVTHKLTFDCTLHDDDQDAGVGLLQESGLDPSATRAPAMSDDPEARDAPPSPRRPWWKIGVFASDEARRPHAPGVWLVYFTLGSLPLFGLAQWLVPDVEEDRHAWLLVYFLAYIASGMGLLLATSFLNLRRYLRRRKVKMPAAMTATWLSTGSVLIVGLTVLAAVLPFPGSGWRVVRGSTPPTTELRASRLAILKDRGVPGEGAASEGPAASKTPDQPSSSGQTKGTGRAHDPDAEQQTAGQGRPGGSSGPGRSRTGAPRGPSSSSPDGTPGERGSSRDQAGKPAQSQEDRSQNPSHRGREAGPDSQPDDQKAAKPTDEASTREKANSKPRGAENPAPRLPSLSPRVPTWLRKLSIAVGAVALIGALFRYGPVLLQAVVDLLASLLGGLWIAQREKPAKDDPGAAIEPAAPPRPFASFVNPFDSGLAQQLHPNDLVVYSFEALEAWASQHDLARSPHETPLEFVRRVGQARADLRPDAQRLVGFFVTIVYGRQGVPADVVPALRQFWQALPGGAA